MSIIFIKKTIMALIVSIFLGYILVATNDILAKIIIIPFLMFGISLFIKNTCLIFKKEKPAKVFSKINIISFFIYYFGFLVYWDFIAITSKDYILAVFSLLAWAGGIFVAYKKYLRFRDVNWLKSSKMEMR